MAYKLLTGPSLPPLQGGAPKKLVVFLHGYGASGDDLIELAYQWRELLPETEFIAPHAPECYEVMPSLGYQWFGLKDFDPNHIIPSNMRAGIEKASPFLKYFLEETLKSKELTPADLALVGFSQGTMMALESLYFLPEVRAIIGYSGAFYPPVSASGLPKRLSESKILLVHGEIDPIIPFVALGESVHHLKQGGLVVETYERPELGHGIDGEGLRRGGNFLRDCFQDSL